MKEEAKFPTKWLLLLIVITLAAAFLAQAVWGYEIAPEHTLLVKCENCTVGTDNHLNETIHIDCIWNESLCDSMYNLSEGVCAIKKHIDDGETLELDEGPCDLNITCGSGYSGDYLNMGYPGIISVRKTENKILMSVNVTNPKGEKVVDWKKELELKDILDLKYPFDYTCPHEVITEVNMQTCAEYLDPILGEQNPMIYQLSVAQNNCTKQLIECHANLYKEKEQHMQSERDYDRMVEARGECEDELEDAQHDLVDPDGVCSVQKDKIWRQGKNEANMWFAVSIVLGVIVVFFVGKSFIGGEGF